MTHHHEEVEPVIVDRLRTDRMAGGLTAALVVSVLLGISISVLARPDATAPVLLVALGQLLATAGFARFGATRPGTVAVVVAIVLLLSCVIDSRLGELVVLGAVPWLNVASVAASYTLIRHATDRATVLVGMAALVLGSGGAAVLAVTRGAPLTLTVIAGAVPFLAGALLATQLQLRNARADRLRRSVSGPAEEETELARARRALVIVALRSDEWLTATRDRPSRRLAGELGDVARRALTGPTIEEHGMTRIEIHSGPPGPAAEDTSASTPMLEPKREATDLSALTGLSEREREVLRLVSRGESNATIARSLYLSEATVKQYVSRLMRRFERDNRTQLALLASRWFE